MSVAFSKGEKIWMVGGANLAIAVAIIGIYFFSINESEAAYFFYLFLTTMIWATMIPFIGKLKDDALNVPRLIFFVLGLKISVLVMFELVDAAYFPEDRLLFPGFFDFESQYLYVTNFLNKMPTYLPIPGGGYAHANYPPGVALVYLFLTSLNPAENTFLYRLYMLIFEAGTYYLIWKLAGLPRFNISVRYRNMGVIYSFFSLSFLSVVDFFAKYDILLIFLTLVGMYFYFNERFSIASAMFVFCGFIKLYPFVWVAGIVIVLLRQKKFKHLLEFVVGGSILGGAVLCVTVLMEGTQFFDLIFGFKFQVGDVYPIYMMNFWFFISYTRVPFMNVVPYILLAACVLYYFMKTKEYMKIEFFLKTMAMVLFFYPAVNVSYILFIMPLICIGLMNSIKKIRLFALLEAAAMWFEQLFNTIVRYLGISIGTLILDIDVLPPWWYLTFRLINLALFMGILVVIMFPRWFSAFFPPEHGDEPQRTRVSSEPPAVTQIHGGPS